MDRPPYSEVLNPPDLFLWGPLKKICYRKKPKFWTEGNKEKQSECSKGI